jgi:predicted dehydrogenase
MTDQAAWGILGTGSIAHMFAEAIQASSTGRVAAVASRDPARAARFATRFGIDRS